MSFQDKSFQRSDCGKTTRVPFQGRGGIAAYSDICYRVTFREVMRPRYFDPEHFARFFKRLLYR